MLLVGERIDDMQLTAGRGDDGGFFLLVGSNHQRAHPALEVARDVLERLADAFGELRRKMQRVAAELADGDLERRPRPQRRLLEQQRDVQPGECGRRLTSEPAVDLHLRGGRQQAIEIDRRQVENGQEVLRERDRRRRFHHERYSPLIRTYSALRSQVQIVAPAPPPVPRLTSIRTSAFFRCSPACGAASSCGSPFSKSRMPPTCTVARSMSKIDA